MPIFTWNVPLISLIFLKRSLVFAVLLFSSIYLHCSFKTAFLSLLAILWISTFSWLWFPLSSLPFISFFSCLWSLLRHHFAFLHFIFFGMLLVTVSCRMLRTSVYRSSGTLSTWSNPLNLFITPLYNHKGFDLDHNWMAYWFSLLSSV